MMSPKALNQIHLLEDEIFRAAEMESQLRQMLDTQKPLRRHRKIIQNQIEFIARRIEIARREMLALEDKYLPQSVVEHRWDAWPVPEPRVLVNFISIEAIAPSEWPACAEG